MLRDVHVLGVSGTHGKTTTSSMLAWILEHAGLAPGFPHRWRARQFFDVSARLGGRTYFVIEADEYDTAFFDKRAKFVHYRSRTLILNNLEFDHADIYENLGAIQKQFHHLVRTVPAPAASCGTPAMKTCRPRSRWAHGRRSRDLRARRAAASPGRSTWQRAATFPSSWCSKRQARGTVNWALLGAHNAENALAAIGAARHVGVSVAQSIAALAEFKGVKRRMELRGEVRGISVYDDFAHHPTAIASTIDGLRRKVGGKRIVAVLEPRSATMRMGVHRDTLAPSLAAADSVWMFAPPDLGWDAGRGGRHARPQGKARALAR